MQGPPGGATRQQSPVAGQAHGQRGIRDRAGNTLVDVRVVAEEELMRLAEQVPVPASSIADAAVMMFESWRSSGSSQEVCENQARPRVKSRRESCESGQGAAGAVPGLAPVSWQWITPAT
jgi:hypothetical protein